MTRNVLLVAVALFGASSLPATAQIKVDMNQVTCGDWLGYDAANQQFVRFWMSGYYNASQNSNVLNLRRMQANTQKVLAYCKKNKSQTLPTAIQRSAS